MSFRTGSMIWSKAGLFACVIAACFGCFPVSAFTAPITLGEAVDRALNRSPELAARSLEVEATESRGEQAGMRSNPEFSVELEEFGGRGDFRELRSAQLTVQLSQTLDLGALRGKRRRAESLVGRSAALDLEWRRRLLAHEVTVRFVAILAAQERSKLARALVELQEGIEEVVVKRVAAGKDPPLEATRVRVEVTEAELDRRLTERELELSRRGLASTWGAREAVFEYAAALEAEIRPPGDRDQLVSGLQENPQMYRRLMEEERAEAEFLLAKAKRVPVLTLYGGVRHMWETDEQAFVAGIAVPIPLFDRNQGGVREAGLLVSAAAEEGLAADARLRLELDEAYARLADSYAAVTAFGEDIVPAAEETFETALSGYRSGKYAYLQVLDAQRTLFEILNRQVAAREEYFLAWADMQLLAGPSPAARSANESEERTIWVYEK